MANARLIGKMLRVAADISSAYQQTNDLAESPAMSLPPSGSKVIQDSERLRNLEDRIDRLILIIQAMWTLVQEKTGLNDEDLMERVKYIDLLDGVEDNKRTQHIKKCPKCQRTMAPRHRRCLYCGQGLPQNTAFDKVT